MSSAPPAPAPTTTAPPTTAPSTAATTTKQKIIKFQNPIPPKATLSDRLLLISLWAIFLTYTFVILFESFILPSQWCPYAGIVKTYPNPDSAPSNVCYYYRTPYLLGLNPFECDFARRVIASLLFGSCIGYERKAADRPAGVRTMSLVCLGACLFTMCGQFAFRATTQEWDAARVSAAVPSGVGFLGSALIWKETTGPKGSADERHSVHGLTTAASVWLSASVGIGAGGALYIYCAWAVVLVVFVLRLGPRMVLAGGEDSSFGGGETGSEWETGEGTGDELDDDNEPKPFSREEQWIKLQEEAAANAAVHQQQQQQQLSPPVSPSSRYRHTTTAASIMGSSPSAASLLSAPSLTTSQQTTPIRASAAAAANLSGYGSLPSLQSGRHSRISRSRGVGHRSTNVSFRS